MKSHRITRNVVFVLFTMLLVLGLAMFVSGTALSQSNEKVVADEAGLRSLEQKYISDIRTYLEEQGFQNSGVTLTWIMEADGSRSYEVALHHKGIAELSVAEQEVLLAEVQELAFWTAGCNFHVNLLV